MNDVLIVSIGTAFMPGTKQSYERAANYYRQHGGKCRIEWVNSMCIMPYFGLNAMRNYWLCKAALRGHEYVFLVDNDILLEDETVLTQLVERDKDWIVPAHKLPQDCDDILAEPVDNRSDLLRPLEWAAVCCELVNTRIIAKTGPHPFTESFITHEDEYTGMSLLLQGVEIWQDRNVAVRVLRPSNISGVMETYKGLREAAFK